MNIKKQTIINSNATINSISASNGVLSGLSQIHPYNINVPALKIALFPDKKVIEAKLQTIEQMIASAESRLKVFIDSETTWQIENFKKDNACRVSKLGIGNITWNPKLNTIQPFSKAPVAIIGHGPLKYKCNPNKDKEVFKPGFTFD